MSDRDTVELGWGDREGAIRLLAAGFQAYLPKPVDPDQLVSLMRVWLYR